jgi:Spy/CpxP family protein refolding chaperone
MKNKAINFRKITAVMIGMILTVSLIAQRGRGPGPFNADRPERGHFCHALPDLTEEQEQKIDELRTTQMKEMNAFRSDLGIMRAELHKLCTADDADMEKINARIDEIFKTKTEMAKQRAAHIQKVRALLTDEQRTKFDSRHMHQGKGMRMGRGGFHRSGEGHGHHCPHGIM